MIKCTCGYHNDHSASQCGLCGKTLKEVKVKELKPKKAYKINPVSEGQAEKNSDYKKARSLYMKHVTTCEFEGCLRPAVECHHKKGRIGADKNGMPRICDMRYFMACCEEHHKWITDNNKLATEKGYAIDKNGNT